MNSIKAVLFDMDGVLVDSEEFICRAAILMFHEMHINAIPSDFKPFVGTGELKYIGGVAGKYGLTRNLEDMKDRTYQIYKEITHGKLKPLPGALEFIAKCKHKGLKIAVATSADKIKMQINLEETGLNEALFDATVNGLEVERKKPNPDIFILAAQKMGYKPKQCLVVEDAVNGVIAAKKAGAFCLALTTSFTKEELMEADWIAENLATAPEEVLDW